VKTIITARYEDLTKSMRENEVFWDVMPRRMVNSHRWCGAAQCLHTWCQSTWYDTPEQL